MFEVALSSLAADLLRNWNQPDMLWQSLILLGILALGWIAERVVSQRKLEESARRAVQFSHGGLKRLVFPLVALALALITREVMRPLLDVSLLSLAVPLLGSLAVIRFVFFVLRVSLPHSAWMQNFERIFASLVWFGVALHILGLMPETIAVFEAISFSVGKQQLNLWLILQGLLLVAAAMLVSLWLGSLIENRLMHARGLDSNLQVVFSRLVKALLLMLAIMVALPAVGIDLTALSVFGGALGVGLGFGLQKIASNYVSGFIILLERAIRLGNVITVGAEKGKVIKITTRYTVLRAGNGVESLIPNEALVSGTVQNETYSDSRVRQTLPLQIAYQDSPELATSLLETVASQHELVSTLTAPKAYVTLFADSGINMELLYWLDSPDINGSQVRSDLHIRILKAFAEAGISIPYPQREVRLLAGEVGTGGVAEGALARP